jgi:hypothetical protein
MTEHSLWIDKGETIKCSRCNKKITGPATVQLVASPVNDEQIGESLCQKCSDKRGE